MQHWGSLNIQNGVLWRKCIDKCRDYLQLVLPAKLQVDTLRDLHEGAIGGHLGEEKNAKQTQRAFLLARMYRSSQRLVQNLHSLYNKKDSCSEKKGAHDDRVHGKPFSPGDLVWLHSPAVSRGRSRKLHHPWKGPLKVVERLGESNYKIKSLQGRKKTQIVHFDRLKPCVALPLRIDKIVDRL